jgi:hypothetical protein
MYCVDKTIGDRRERSPLRFNLRAPRSATIDVISVIGPTTSPYNDGYEAAQTIEKLEGGNENLAGDFRLFHIALFSAPVIGTHAPNGATFGFSGVLIVYRGVTV